MLKAVLFDMDGVIIDSEPAYVKMDIAFCRDLGFTLTEPEQRKFTGSSSRHMWEVLKPLHALPQPIEELMGLQAERVAEFYRHGDLMPIEGTLRLMRELHARGIACAVATSSVEHNARTMISRLELAPYVSAVATSSQVRHAKPAPDIFLLAAEFLGAKPEECLVIEDSRNGCVAGKAAGMKVVGFQNLNSGNQDLSSADVIISDMGELTADKLLTLMES